MKIESNPVSVETAIELLKFLDGGCLRPVNPRLLVADDGTLTLESSLHPLNDDQAVVLANIESDSFGDGWGNASAVDMLEYLREWDQPLKAYSISVIDSNGREWEGLISQHGLLPCAEAAFAAAVSKAREQELHPGQTVTIALIENDEMGNGYPIESTTLEKKA
jgi:hypothetical protein